MQKILFFRFCFLSKKLSITTRIVLFGAHTYIKEENLLKGENIILGEVFGRSCLMFKKIFVNMIVLFWAHKKKKKEN